MHFTSMVLIFLSFDGTRLKNNIDTYLGYVIPFYHIVKSVLDSPKTFSKGEKLDGSQMIPKLQIT